MPWGWDWIAREHRNFRKVVEQDVERRLIWLGSNRASELAGYLFYLDSYADVAAEVARPDEYLPAHPKYGAPGSIGILNEEQLADSLDNAPCRPVADDVDLFGRWRDLKAEGAELRAIENGRLISVPIDHFDRLLLAAAPSEWTRHVRVVGNALGAAFDENLSISSELLFSRLGALVRSGKLQAQGNVHGWTEEGPREQAMVRRTV